MRGKAPVKIYPCPKCSGKTILIIEGHRAICTDCGTEGYINKWNALYRSTCGGPKYTGGQIFTLTPPPTAATPRPVGLDQTQGEVR
jgi:hypothetical protein